MEETTVNTGDEKQLEIQDKKLLIEDENAKRDAQRKMCWFSLFGMLLYPICIIISGFFDLPNAITGLGSIAGTYFVSVSAIVMAYFASEVFNNKIPK